MAKIVSHIASSIRGSIAGITYLTTPSGAIIARQRVIPVNPGSTFQTRARQAMGATAVLWTQLTDAQREAWNAAAGTTSFLLGRSFTTPGDGRGLFMATGQFVNYMYAQNKLAEPFNGVAPNSTGVPTVILSNVPYEGSVGTTGISFKATNTSLARAAQIVYWYGYQVNGSRTYYRGPWQTGQIGIGQVEPEESTVINITYSPDPLEGQKLFVRAVPLFIPEGSYVGYAKGSPQIISDTLQTAEA